MELVALVAQTVVLLVFSWLVWVNVVAPGGRERGFAEVFAQAALWVLTAWLVSAIALVSLYLIVSAPLSADGPGKILRLSLMSAAPAMWLAPAMILMAAFSPAPMFAGLILLINVTSVLIRRWTRLEGVSLPGPLFRSSLPSLAGGLGLQTGAVALWLDYRLFAAAMFFGASAMLTAQAIVAGAYWPKKSAALPPALLSPAVAFLLALVLTATGIQMSTEGHEGLFASARTILRRLWHTPQAPAEPQQAVTRLYLPKDRANVPGAAPQDTQAPGNGGFPGVVLRAKPKPEKQLTVPPRPVDGGRTEVLSRPLHIPFTGEYWLYQAFLAPLTSPPNRSAVRFGNPLELSFHTSDYRPMRMEAHQRLNPPIALDCCSSIQLVVDRAGEPEPVAVDLSAVDSTKLLFRPGRETWLGTAVMSGEPSQALTFSIPPHSHQRRSDELEAVFRLQQYNGMQAAAQSLHVEIREIVLTP